MSARIIPLRRKAPPPAPPSLLEQAEAIEAIHDQLGSMLPRLLEHGLAPEEAAEFLRRLDAGAETLRRLAQGGGAA